MAAEPQRHVSSLILRRASDLRPSSHIDAETAQMIAALALLREHAYNIWTQTKDLSGAGEIPVRIRGLYDLADNYLNNPRDYDLREFNVACTQFLEDSPALAAPEILAPINQLKPHIAAFQRAYQAYVDPGHAAPLTVVGSAAAK